MKVYIVFEQVEDAYNYGVFHGVFSTFEKAAAFIRGLCGTHIHFTENGGTIEIDDDCMVLHIGREIYINECEVDK